MISMVRFVYIVMIASAVCFSDAIAGEIQTKERAVEIATKELVKLGYDMHKMAMRITRCGTPWNEWLPKDSTSEYVKERQKRLENREYWAVYCYPKPTSTEELYLGGDICVFVDSKTGDVITTYRGK
jgi:hypothetical protein